MNVQVRVFAMLRERAGSGALELELPDGATVGDALAALDASGPLAGLISRLPVQMAVNRDYADAKTQLHASDELALIPPVSGGSGEEYTARAQAPGEPPSIADSTAAPAPGAVERVRAARITAEPLSISRLCELVASPAAGALVLFSGMTREVGHLDYEAYIEMAEPQLATIAAACAERNGLEAIAVEHRVGAVALGEPSVLIAASAGHRGEAFAGAREAIDLIKQSATIWKREAGSGSDPGATAQSGPANALAKELEHGGWVHGGDAPAGAAPVAQLTHLDGTGKASMVDVGDKQTTTRRARARALVRMSSAAAARVAAGDAPKGEVIGTARIAGIQAAKQAGLLIPLAHPLTLSHVAVDARVDVRAGKVVIESEVRTEGRTGVEIEAMTACSVAALTVYDMVKGIEKGVVIEEVLLLQKSGGRADWHRDEAAEPAPPGGGAPPAGGDQR